MLWKLLGLGSRVLFEDISIDPRGIYIERMTQDDKLSLSTIIGNFVKDEIGQVVERTTVEAAAVCRQTMNDFPYNFVYAPRKSGSKSFDPDRFSPLSEVYGLLPSVVL